MQWDPHRKTGNQFCHPPSNQLHMEVNNHDNALLRFIDRRRQSNSRNNDRSRQDGQLLMQTQDDSSDDTEPDYSVNGLADPDNTIVLQFINSYVVAFLHDLHSEGKLGQVLDDTVELYAPRRSYFHGNCIGEVRLLKAGVDGIFEVIASCEDAVKILQSIERWDERFEEYLLRKLDAYSVKIRDVGDRPGGMHLKEFA